MDGASAWAYLSSLLAGIGAFVIVLSVLKWRRG